MQELVKITKALADTNRLRILTALEERELCVCQITELLELAPSTVSKHLLLLRQAGLISSRKNGRWMHYQLVRNDAPKLADEWLRFVLGSIKDHKLDCSDKQRLKQILRMDPEVLCCRQRND